MSVENLKIKNPNGKKHVVVRNDQELTIFLLDRASGNRNFELVLDLEGENATCKVVGVVEGNHQDEKIWDITQNLHGKSQKAEINVHGVGAGNSRLQISGRGIIKQTSEGGEVMINERVILFDSAKAKALPVLRVETDDVAAASHGASVAPIDRAQIFYLMSKGIAKSEAERMIKEGFLNLVSDAGDFVDFENPHSDNNGTLKKW